MVLWDLRPQGITGNKIEKACDVVSITVNKNAIAGDVSALAPGGVRLGAPALTSRGLKEAEFEKIADFLDRVIKISVSIQEAKGKKLQDFVAALADNAELKALKEEVEAFAKDFPLPGL